MSTTVKKRNGENEEYQPGKITAAMQKAFDSDGVSISAEELQKILERVEALLEHQEQPQVEVQEPELVLELVPVQEPELVLGLEPEQLVLFEDVRLVFSLVPVLRQLSCSLR